MLSFVSNTQILLFRRSSKLSKVSVLIKMTIFFSMNKKKAISRSISTSTKEYGKLLKLLPKDSNPPMRIFQILSVLLNFTPRVVIGESFSFFIF